MENIVFDKHKQDFNEVRRLCLLCHGLDLTSSNLFIDSTYEEPSENTISVIHSMLSSSILNLAIAIRINIYQGAIKGKEYVLDLVVASYYENDDPEDSVVTIKDICDKIIHAEEVDKSVWPADFLNRDIKVSTQFKGRHRKKEWTLNLSLEMFSESVLQLLDSIENEQSSPST